MAITAANISKAQLKHCLLLYPDVIDEVYDSRIKNSKKLFEAKVRDKWRYEELPNALKVARGMSLAELERLVQWKITHGQNRPFLPSMVRKNDAGTVTKATEKAAKLLSSLNATTTSQKALELTLSALDAACILTGVGPATGALVLSVYDPNNAVFFQDELFAWCVPEKKDTKLKYDKKEYSELFKRAYDLRERLGDGTQMVELEKASFVLQHLDVVDEASREALEAGPVDSVIQLANEQASSKATDSKGTSDAETSPPPAVQKAASRNTTKTKRKKADETATPAAKRKRAKK
ncbi:uncharacterized protein AB675_6295 [Cyphellophora attinorum]|uniref:Uncharacterized protein n=1 Tax=Cyphellophora attinorum TaxID=1664694 RepID=A0A0N1H974_9EURO|nr:uncharacterized protein AB675_6295 [Phialophora attinorum]KPI43897.1 hypothetical protein AB675_6295 [Phialophora attinorum]